MLKLVLAFALVAAAPVGSYAEGPSPASAKDVLDLYLLLPDSAMPIGPARAKRLAAIKVKDVANGYLHLEGDFDGYSDVALFKLPNGRRVVAVVNTFCGPDCMQDMYFLEPTAEGWNDRTKEIFSIPRETIVAAYRAHGLALPDDPNATPPYLVSLPEKGRTITVYAHLEETNKDVDLLTLGLDGDRFAATAH